MCTHDAIIMRVVLIVYDGSACHRSCAAQLVTCAAQVYRTGDWQQLANDMQNVYQVNRSSTNAAVT
jgi:hypothetical protein